MGKQPDPIPSLLTRLRKIEEWMRRKDSSSPFFGTGVHPNGNQGLDSDNYVSGTSGFSLNGGTGVAEFKDIVLYDLPNSMLASPVLTTVHHAEADSFAIGNGANVAKATVTVTVPAGYTKAQVTAFAMVNGFNTASAEDQLFCVAYIQSDTSRGWSASQHVAVGKAVSLNNTATAQLTGLTGGSTFTVKAATSTSNFNWPADSGNVANIDATILWTR